MSLTQVLLSLWKGEEKRNGEIPKRKSIHLVIRSRTEHQLYQGTAPRKSHKEGCKLHARDPGRGKLKGGGFSAKWKVKFKGRGENEVLKTWSAIAEGSLNRWDFLFACLFCFVLF